MRNKAGNTKLVALHESTSRGIVVNTAPKPTTPPPAFTSRSGATVRPSSADNASGQPAANSGEKKG